MTKAREEIRDLKIAVGVLRDAWTPERLAASRPAPPTPDNPTDRRGWHDALTDAVSHLQHAIDALERAETGARGA